MQGLGLCLTSCIQGSGSLRKGFDQPLLQGRRLAEAKWLAACLWSLLRAEWLRGSLEKSLTLRQNGRASTTDISAYSRKALLQLL